MLIRWLSHSNGISSSSLYSFVTSIRFGVKLLRWIYEELYEGVRFRRVFFSMIDVGYTFPSYLFSFNGDDVLSRFFLETA